MTEKEKNAAIDRILSSFAACGHLDYGESISMQEHMLQAACFAATDGADDRLIVATLLHDYGHLVCNLPNNTFAEGHDNCHEEIGAAALQNWFDAEITEAIRSHVDAKRYLCANDSGYFDILSDASKLTLEIQGGPMSIAESSAFRQTNASEMALRVRRYDDQGKLCKMRRADLEFYVPKIKACLS